MQDKRNFYINGCWVAPIKANDFEVTDPSSEKVCAVISLGDKADTDAAVKAAKDAFESWSQTSTQTRLSFLKAILLEYKNRWNDLAQAISSEMGAPIDLAMSAQVGSGYRHIQGFIDSLEKMNFEASPSEDNYKECIIKEPIGVCGLITPWNWPMNQITLKVIPAIAVGCTVILKPSEIAPLSALVFAEIIAAVKLPAGVFNLVNGDGAGVGTQLSSHKDVDMLSFTGSTRAGTLITKSAADTVKRVALELGGKGANIIFADADENAVKRGVLHCFNNSGQSCNAPTRMLVERSIYQKSVQQAQQIAETVNVDDPSKPGSHIGPVVGQQQYHKIQSLIKVAIDEGANLIAGGLGMPEGIERGYYVKPTIFCDVSNDMQIAKEEVFGPLLVIMPFDTEEEAIAITNDTVYGLANYIQTQDPQRIKRVARKIRSGMVRVNGVEPTGAAPFGGYKQSGNGREGGVWGMEDFLEIKHVTDWS